MSTGRTVEVDGIATHVLEAGSGPALVLLHSGEFGACAELSWGHLIAPLAVDHRVIAPDWLGYGGTDKVRDFVDGPGRMLRHLARLLEVLGIGEAVFVGNSMAATLLLRDAAGERPRLPATALVCAAGGGYAPDNEHRRALTDYDGSFEGMRRIVAALFHAPRFAADDDLVARRHRLSLEPGAWEWAASARLRSPAAPPRPDFGGADTTPYHRIRVPTLLVAGAQDKLREPGYGERLRAAVPGSELVVLDRCGHCPNLERPVEFLRAVRAFLATAPTRAGTAPAPPTEHSTRSTR